MSRIPIQELRRMGVSGEDIETAKLTQLAQRRNGSPSSPSVLSSGRSSRDGAPTRTRLPI